MVIASGVFTVLYIKGVLVYLLALTAGEITFTLLGDDIGYKSLLGLEVIAHCLSLVRGTVILKHRCALELADGVRCTVGIYRAVLQVHFYMVGIKLYLAVLHMAFTIHICLTATHEYH